MSFKPYTEKVKKKKIGICSILGRIRIRIQNRTRIHHPGSGSADPDPDPHQNDTDPKHCNIASPVWFVLYLRAPCPTCINSNFSNDD